MLRKAYAGRRNFRFTCFPTPIGFGVDFQAMEPNWPVKGCAPEVREALLTRIHELAQGKLEPLVSTRFLLQRTTEGR